jgi:hypothetical protein
MSIIVVLHHLKSNILLSYMALSSGSLLLIHKGDEKSACTLMF